MSTPDYTQQDLHADEDRAEAAKRWPRGYFQVRGTFVQNPDRTSADRSSTLARLVEDRQPRALVLYLRLIANWPWLATDKIPLEAQGWINLLHSRPNGRGTWPTLVWSESTLSRTWRYLADAGLVTKKRGKKGHLKVVPQLEDGSGEYEFPTGEKQQWHEVYFTVPDRFWLQEDFAKLRLPGLAMLMLLLKETNQKAELRITNEQVSDWYGFARSTVAKGLKELRDLDLLEERVEWIPARLSKIRTTSATHYSLKHEYSTDARKIARQNAERRRRRAAPTSVTSVGFTSDDVRGGERDGGDEDAA